VRQSKWFNGQIAGDGVGMQVVSFKTMRFERRGDFCARMQQARIVWLAFLLTQHGAGTLSRKASAHVEAFKQLCEDTE
jgi:hypothetical protein